MKKPNCALCGVKIKTERVRKVGDGSLLVQWRKYCERRGVPYSRTDDLHDKCKSRVWKYCNKDPPDTRKVAFSRQIRNHLRRRTALFQMLLGELKNVKKGPLLILERLQPETINKHCSKVCQKPSPEVGLSKVGHPDNGSDLPLTSEEDGTEVSESESEGLHRILTSVIGTRDSLPLEGSNEQDVPLEDGVELIVQALGLNRVEVGVNQGTNSNDIQDRTEQATELERIQANGNVAVLDVEEAEKTGEFRVEVNGAEGKTQQEECLIESVQRNGSGMESGNNFEGETETHLTETEEEAQGVVVPETQETGSLLSGQSGFTCGTELSSLLNLQVTAVDLEVSEKVAQLGTQQDDNEIIMVMNGITNEAEDGNTSENVMTAADTRNNFVGTEIESDQIICENTVESGYKACVNLENNFEEEQMDSVSNGEGQSGMDLTVLNRAELQQTCLEGLESETMQREDNQEIYEKISEDEEWDVSDKNGEKRTLGKDSTNHILSNLVIEAQRIIQSPEGDISLSNSANPVDKSVPKVLASFSEIRNKKQGTPRGKANKKGKCIADVVDTPKTKLENKGSKEQRSCGKGSLHSKSQNGQIHGKGYSSGDTEYSYTTPLKGLYKPENIQYGTGMNGKSRRKNPQNASSTYDAHRLTEKEICEKYDIDEKDRRSGHFDVNKIISNHRRIVSLQFENIQLLQKYRKSRQDRAAQWKAKVAEIVNKTDKTVAQSKLKRKDPEQAKKAIGGITDISKIPMPPLPKIGDKSPFNVGCINASLTQ